MIKIRMTVWLVLCMSLVIESVANEISDVPVTKDATDITDSGFTANWEPVIGAIRYGIYTILTHTAPSDGVYHIVNDRFDLVERGTEENPYPGDQDFEYLNDYMNRADWTIAMPLYVSGQLGLDNRFGDFLPAELKSPLYDLSHDNGKVSVAMTAKAVENVDSIILVLCDHNGVVLDSSSSKLNKEWTEMRFELHGGVKECYLKMNLTGDGIMYLDDLRLSQFLRIDESVEVACQNIVTKETSHYFYTSDKLTGDAYSYRVSAYVGGVWSDYSEPEKVIAASDISVTEKKDDMKVYMGENLHVVLFKNAMINIYSANGVRVAVQNGECGDNVIKLNAKGLYLVEVGDKVYRVIK